MALILHGKYGSVGFSSLILSFVRHRILSSRTQHSILFFRQKVLHIALSMGDTVYLSDLAEPAEGWSPLGSRTCSLLHIKRYPRSFIPGRYPEASLDICANNSFKFSQLQIAKRQYNQNVQHQFRKFKSNSKWYLVIKLVPSVRLCDEWLRGR